MKTIQTPAVVSTRNEMNRLLKLVPDKRYSDSTVTEKKAFDDLSDAMEAHRKAVRIARISN